MMCLYYRHLHLNTCVLLTQVNVSYLRYLAVIQVVLALDSKTVLKDILVSQSNHHIKREKEWQDQWEFNGLLQEIPIIEQVHIVSSKMFFFKYFLDIFFMTRIGQGTWHALITSFRSWRRCSGSNRAIGAGAEIIRLLFVTDHYCAIEILCSY